jgi:hypothetical protein
MSKLFPSSSLERNQKSIKEKVNYLITLHLFGIYIPLEESKSIKENFISLIRVATTLKIGLK